MKRALSNSTLLFALCLGLSGCTDRESVDGVDRALAIRSAQFVKGELPGSAPLPIDSTETPSEPTTTSPLADVAFITPRLSNVRFSGLATAGAVAVAVRFEDLDDGYWLVPTGLPDPQAGGRVAWSFTADFGASLPAGIHSLAVVAIDQNGHAGTQTTANLCARSLIPDNGNACYANIAPPALVVSLAWDTPVDLDLKLTTPQGTVIESKRPASGTVSANGEVDASQPNAGKLDLDSNRDCAIDGRQRENVSFEQLPPPGNYAVYANLSRSCGQRSVSYFATYYLRTNTGDSTFGTSEHDIGAGTLVDLQENGDTQLGTYVGELKIQ